MEFEQIIILLVGGLYGAVIILIVMWMKMMSMGQNQARSETVNQEKKVEHKNASTMTVDDTTKIDREFNFTRK